MPKPSVLRVEHSFIDDSTLLIPSGVLDLTTYAELRDTLLKYALEIPRAVIVDVGSLMVPTDATLAVFSSVWMQVSDWPGVPIVLVASRPLDRRRLGRSAITRFLPVCSTVKEALASLEEPPLRRRTVLELPYDPVSAATARRFVQVTCARWGCDELLIDAELIASELVENAVRHAHSESQLRLELLRDFLTIAVYDDNPEPATLVDLDLDDAPQLGLLLVAQLATTWNCAPTLAGGKVVWAVMRLPRPVSDDGARWRARRVITGR
jgi:anti-sigma regulatory factor (Ser/Thr protein kinase)